MQNVACFPHVQAIHGDFREVALPSRGPYSVVANLPFSLTATSLRLLVEAANPPSSAFLVVQREVAMTWALQGRGTLAATVAQLRFAFDVPLALRRRDFVPWPRVDSVVLAMHRRERPLLPDGEARRFAGFVARGYGGGRPTLSHNLRAVARERPLRAALDRAGIPPGAAPSGLGIEQWLALWRSLSALS
jgi:16S rRNA A1518/A1519 N6-dimethyltransferase RsmA/KsgA/DIM1 with predicted DNA glycosylase/AP lyase activity